MPEQQCEGRVKQGSMLSIHLVKREMDWERDQMVLGRHKEMRLFEISSVVRKSTRAVIVQSEGNKG